MADPSPQVDRPGPVLWPAVVVALGGLLLAWLVGRAWSPDAVVVEVPAETEVVVLGSSIAMANVSAPVVASRLGLDPNAVVQLGERASQPAHWVALMRHHVAASGARPAHVVVVTPLDVLLREVLRSAVDTERLLVLLRSPDAPLWTAAVGGGGHARFWGRQQAAARRVIRGGLGGWLPELLGLSGALQAAREQASAVPRTDAERPVWLVDPSAPRPGSASDQPEGREPDRGDVASWTLAPMLVDAARTMGATLWVVAPPVRPEERGPVCSRSRRFTTVVAGLEALGARVVDASDAPLDRKWFRTRYHLEGEGTTRFSEQLAAVLDGEAPAWPRCTATRGRAGG